MSKSHTVKLTITNNTNQEMNYQSDSFDSGRLADGGSWPATIASGKSEIIECCEKDWSAVGCSGYVNYSLGDGIVTLAFSNPTIGENKLGVGVGNKQVWDRIEGHKYEPFIEEFEIGSQRYFAACKCTGGKINNASIALSALAILPYNPNETMEFNVIQYNVFARPENPKLLGYEGKEERLPKIPEALAQLNEGKVDIITLNEVFSQVGTPLCDQMLNEFKKYGFPYHTRVLDGGMLEKVGGVMIVSKWPLHADTYVYSDMPTIDNEDISVGLGEKIVAKGVVYAAVKKTEKGFTKTFHIFATHMRAWNSQTARETRQKQAKQMKEFVEAKNIPNNEPIFFAGDW